MQISVSDKINLIKEISTRLGSEEWSIIDLTLNSFGLPTNESWNGDRPSYVMSMIHSTEIAQLVELGNHVGYALDNGKHHNLEPAFWKKSRLRMFVSHLATHKVQASELQNALNNRGISCFVAHTDIEPTLEWQSQIELALATCDVLVALLQPDFHASKWTDQEVGFAMGRGVPIFAVRLGQDPYGFIGRFQAFNGHGKNNSEIANEIFTACCKNKQTQEAMASALVAVFEESSSFADAKTRIGYLASLEVWNKSFVQRIQKALEANGQISGSWGVPDQVKALVNKWSK